MSEKSDIEIAVRDVSIGYGSRVLMEHLNFEVKTGEIFCIMGGSGCGKSTLLKHIIGLYSPMRGDILIRGKSIVKAGGAERQAIMREFGVTYQGGALFGSMTVAENVALPLEEYTALSPREIRERVAGKLALVDLDGFGDYLPASLSGGMRKRAGLARALALEPKLLFFDEPSAGLDPITSAALDRLILKLRDQYGATIVIVTHELDSIFTVCDRVIILDRATRGIVAEGQPRTLLEHSGNRRVRDFLSRDGLRRAEFDQEHES